MTLNAVTLYFLLWRYLFYRELTHIQICVYLKQRNNMSCKLEYFNFVFASIGLFCATCIASTSSNKCAKFSNKRTFNYPYLSRIRSTKYIRIHFCSDDFRWLISRLIPIKSSTYLIIILLTRQTRRFHRSLLTMLLSDTNWTLSWIGLIIWTNISLAILSKGQRNFQINSVKSSTRLYRRCSINRYNKL